jgi:hypothetical protein
MEELEKFRSRLVAGFNGECESLAKSISKELHSLRAQASKVEQLQQENLKLRAQVQILTSKPQNSTSENGEIESTTFESDSNWRLGYNISSTTTQVIRQHPELKNLLDSQAREYGKLQKAHEIVLEKLREAQSLIKGFQSTRNATSNNQHVRDERLSRSRNIVTSSDEPVQRNESFNNTTKKNQHVDENVSESLNNDVVLPEDGHKLLKESPENSKDTITTNDQLLGTGSTDNPKDARKPTLQRIDKEHTESENDDSSQPEVVSERPVKKRRLVNRMKAGSSMSYVEEVRIKQEDEVVDLSSPIYEPLESMDLDAINTPITIPNRNRNPNTTVVEPQIIKEPQPIISRASRQGNEVNPSINSKPVGVEQVQHVYREQKFPPRPKAYDQRFEIKDPAAIKSLNLSYGTTQTSRPEPSTQRPKSFDSYHDRNGFRNENRRSLWPDQSTPHNNAKKPQSANPRINKFTSDRNKSIKDQRNHQLNVEQRVNVLNPKRRRLRDTPLNELSSDDFRLNPDLNQGLNYAYSETVRNKADRKCLPNCTRPDCCGNALAKASEIGGSLPRMLDGALDNGPRGRDEERRFIKEHLGLPMDTLLNISDKLHQQYLQQAKTKHFAGQFGKHRNAHERATSPPGYWRVEFPTTQEVDEDNATARELDRMKVQERWHEAMRPGGRWIFRDE